MNKIELVCNFKKLTMDMPYMEMNGPQKSFNLIIFFYILLLGLTSNCSSIKPLSSKDRSDLYRAEFLGKIYYVKEKYREGLHDQALAKLKEINEEELRPSEKALRRNLMGVLLFSKSQYEQAISNFDQALSNSKLDPSLNAQVYLNLAASYFKLGVPDKAYSALMQSRVDVLNEDEAQKYFILHFKLAKDLGKDEEVVQALIGHLGGKKSLTELKSDIYFQSLLDAFFKLDKSRRFRILQQFEKKKSLVVGYLGYLDAEKLYYTGEKSDAGSLLEWALENFSEHLVLNKLIEGFHHRIQNYARIDPRSIGIILPLSGKKEAYGRRALLGIDLALSNLNKNLPKGEAAYTVHIKDSEATGAIGRYLVRELIEKKFVSAIIGGLFSDEADAEYLEAKKYGVLFVSLSQVYLPRELKDHLLLEIPGSVESQMAKLFDKKTLERFGKRTAIFHPDDSRGQAYLNEFWKMAARQNVEVSGVLAYNKNQTDYRDSVQHFLGIKYQRAREEERKILSDIYSLEKNKGPRRIQVLKPQVDFDWIFIPALPREALQIIPSFTYYDAFNLNFFGGPSWRSQALANESGRLGHLFFIGDEVNFTEGEFEENFKKRFGRTPRLIETRAYDSFMSLKSLLFNVEKREDLDRFIRDKEKISGITGNWKMENGIWLKGMEAMELKSNEIKNVFSQNDSAKLQ